LDSCCPDYLASGYAFAVLAFALLVVAAAPTVHIAGRVVDGETKKPVGDAVVIVTVPSTKVENTAVTELESGRFDVEAPVGAVEITVQREGYEPFARMETLLGSRDDWVAVLSPDHLCVPSDPDVYDHPKPYRDWAGSRLSQAFRRLFASSAEDAKRTEVEYYTVPTFGIEEAVRVQRGRKGDASVVALRLEEQLKWRVDKFVWDHEDGERSREALYATAWATVVPRLHAYAAPLSEMTAVRLEQLWRRAIRTATDASDPCARVHMCGADEIYVLGGRAVLVEGSDAGPGTRMRALLDVAAQLAEFASAPAKERDAREGRLLDAIDALLVRFDEVEQNRAQQAP
jgi:hypothetical protein